MVVDRPGTEPQGFVDVLALVDSGAFRSCFPKQIGYELGITDEELTEDPNGGTGVGSRFRFWTTDVPIRAGVALFEPAPDGSAQPWGPGFPLSPAFTETDAFLLGRADFFRAYQVTFEQGTTGNPGCAFILERPDEP